MVGVPVELMEAMTIEAICTRYHCLPSEARKQDAGILKHMAIVDLWRGENHPIAAPAEPYEPYEDYDSEEDELGLAGLSEVLG